MYSDLNELDSVYCWSRTNKIALNIYKCQIMTFTGSQLGIKNDYCVNRNIVYY